MKAALIKCNCKSDYQDQKYGKDVRVANPVQKKGEVQPYRCTVCAKEAVKTVG
jgi:hypothetical protein